MICIFNFRLHKEPLRHLLYFAMACLLVSVFQSKVSYDIFVRLYIVNFTKLLNECTCDGENSKVQILLVWMGQKRQFDKVIRAISLSHDDEYPPFLGGI
jgi:hypothetical protein